MSTTASITGTDGKVPVYDPNSRWSIWNLSEIYMGQEAAGKYVPKVGDKVVDMSTNEEYVVEALDEITLVPTLIPAKKINTGEFDTVDVLIGVGPGTPSDTYRAYLDKTTLPYTLTVERRLFVSGTDLHSAKLFKGSSLNGTEKVISAVYDNTGNLVSNSLPLVLASINDQTNVSTWSIPTSKTTEDLVDGEVITAVIYSNLGVVASKRQLKVENTSFIHSTDASVKYVSSIGLKTPYLSKTDPKVIQYPLNVPLPSLNLMGVVNYSDGSSLELPVDGTKFQLFGFENFVSTIPDVPYKLVLRYNLSAGEIVYGASSVGDDHFKTESFTAITQKMDGVYSLKLFCAPVWIDPVSGYRLEWYLYSLDRNMAYHVTPYVRINENSAPFNPTAYGSAQPLNVSINMKAMNGAYPNFVFVQTLEITLIGAGTERTTNWSIAYEPNQHPRYGVNNFVASTFFNQNLTKIKFDLNAASLNDWLGRLFYDGKPLFDSEREASAPTPTHFILLIDGQEMEFPVSQWNAAVTLNTVLPNSTTLFMKFIKRLPDNDLQLGIAGIPVYQQN